MKRILITGSDGFVGRHAVRAFMERGVEVMGADRKTGIDLSLDQWIHYYVEEHQPDLIVHLASSCSTLGSINRPIETFRDTVVVGATVMEIANRLQIPVILTSSVKARDGMTPYGAAKQMVETWFGECSRTFGVPLIINRPGTIYGPGQEGSFESGWIAWFLRAAREDIEIVINGTGHQVRDLLHVSDYVSLLLRQALRPGSYEGRVWDVGGGEQNIVSVMEMARYLGLRYSHGPSRYGDAMAYVGINDAPGWEPKIYWRESGMFEVQR